MKRIGVDPHSPRAYSDAFQANFVDPFGMGEVPSVLRHGSIFERFWVEAQAYKSNVYLQVDTNKIIPNDIIDANHGHAINRNGDLLTDDNGTILVPVNDDLSVHSLPEIEISLPEIDIIPDY